MRNFQRSLPMELLRSREVVLRSFTPHLRVKGLSQQQWRVLRFLYENHNVPMTTVAEDCYLLMPSLSRIVPQLERKGLLTRAPSEQDQRQSLLSISARGSQLVDEMAPAFEASYQHITEVFGQGKLKLLYELLGELIEKLEKDPRNHRPRDRGPRGS